MFHKQLVTHWPPINKSHLSAVLPLRTWLILALNPWPALAAKFSRVLRPGQSFGSYGVMTLKVGAVNGQVAQE